MTKIMNCLLKICYIINEKIVSKYKYVFKNNRKSFKFENMKSIIITLCWYLPQCNFLGFNFIV